MIEARKSNPFSPKETRMKLIGMTLLTLLLLPLPGWSTDVNLFVIQSSKSANEVQYKLRVDANCQLRSSFPVSAVWHLREAHPVTTEPLSTVEQLAYGVVRQRVDENWVVFRLRALEEKRVKATATYNPHTETCSPIVHVEINTQWAALERVYVQVDGLSVRPKVQYIDVFGESLASSPTPVRERIQP
jgi:hypothetical protein